MKKRKEMRTLLDRLSDKSVQYLSENRVIKPSLLNELYAGSDFDSSNPSNQEPEVSLSDSDKFEQSDKYGIAIINSEGNMIIEPKYTVLDAVDDLCDMGQRTEGDEYLPNTEQCNKIKQSVLGLDDFNQYLKLKSVLADFNLFVDMVEY